MSSSVDSQEVVEKKKKKSKFREYTEALLTALIVALVLRSFVVEAFKVPSGSMVPSIMIGDHLFVNKFSYGLRIPLTKKWVTRHDPLKHGEIAVFIYPVDNSKDFIKRAVGLPGDHIIIEDKKISINGVPVPQTPATARKEDDFLVIEPNTDKERLGTFKVDLVPEWWQFEYFIEEMGDRKFVVQYQRNAYNERHAVTVPEGHFYVVGDNRNRSSDSRDWGFIPIDNLKGRAMFVWLSLDYDDVGIRWERFGHWLE